MLDLHDRAQGADRNTAEPPPDRFHAPPVAYVPINVEFQRRRMRKVSKSRQQKSHVKAIRRRFRDAGLTVARTLLVRSLRRNGLNHALSGRPAIIGFILKNAADTDVYERSIRYLTEMKSDKALTELIEVHHWDHTKLFRRGRDLEADIAKVLASGYSVFGFASNIFDFPSLFRLAADDIVELPPIDVTALQAAAKNAGHHSIPDGVLENALHIPLRVLSILMSRPRHVRSIVERLSQAATLYRVERDAKLSTDSPSLDDLDGFGDAANWGQELAVDLQAFRAGDLLWADVDRGVLLSGPTGTGKTLFAQALARTCRIPIHVHSLARWQAKGYLNDLLQAMRAAFNTAQADAPCILFIDEMDSFGDRDRLAGKNEQYEREVINALLECLDGADRREGVIVVGATNMPDAIDQAILRPGRLGKHIRIPLPDAGARIGILRHYAGDAIPQECIAGISDRLEGASGAVIEQVIRDARRHARSERHPLSLPDIERFLPAQNVQDDTSFEITCVHEAGHVAVGYLLGRVSGQRLIEGRVFRDVQYDGTSGCTVFHRQQAVHRTRASYLAEIAILLAGLAAETVLFGSYSDAGGGGEGSDLHRATVVAAIVEVSLGLGDTLVYRSPAKATDVERLLGDDPHVAHRAAIVLRQCLERAMALVSEHAMFLRDVQNVLRERGCVTAEEVERLHALQSRSM